MRGVRRGGREAYAVLRFELCIKLRVRMHEDYLVVYVSCCWCLLFLLKRLQELVSGRIVDWSSMRGNTEQNRSIVIPPFRFTSR